MTDDKQAKNTNGIKDTKIPVEETLDKIGNAQLHNEIKNIRAKTIFSDSIRRTLATEEAMLMAHRAELEIQAQNIINQMKNCDAALAVCRQMLDGVTV